MPISQKRRLAILAAHGGACHYCAAPGASHVDHIVPQTGGGSDDLGNLIAACGKCNIGKRNHRLPPDREQRALAAAEAARDQVLRLERTIAPDPSRKVKINIMLTAQELQELEAERAADGCRSLSAFARRLMVGQLMKRKAMMSA